MRLTRCGTWLWPITARSTSTPTSVLHKQVVVNKGSVDGLRFGTERFSSGALADAADNANPAATWFNAESTNAAREWLDHLYAQFQTNLVDQLESMRLTEELLNRWPQNSAALEDRVVEIKRRTNELQDRVHQAQANPLRHVDCLENVSDDATKLQADLAALSHDLEKLPDATDADRRAIVAARQQDEKFLREQLNFERIDPNALTAYLLQDQLAGPLSDLMGWVRWVRRTVPAETDADTASTSRRGHNINFPGCPRVPSLIVRSLDLHGSTLFGGQSVDLDGKLTDFSNHPAWHDQPIRLRLNATGSLPVDVQATIDRTGPVPKDQLLVDCGSIVLPKLRLGTSNKLRLSLAPTTATLNVSITLDGDKLSGDIQLVQKHVEIVPSVGPELEQVRMAAALEDSLSDVHSVASRISIRGTIDEPQWELWSNLGPAVAEALDHALARTTQIRAKQVLADAQQRVDERLTQLDRQTSDAQTALEQQLAGTAGTLDDLAERKDDDERLSQEQLGQRLPANSLFR